MVPRLKFGRVQVLSMRPLLISSLLFRAGARSDESRSVRSRLCLLGMLAGCAGLLGAAQSWTVDALLNIPTLSDPQIRPDGRGFAYVQRSLEGKVWRSTIYIGAIPSGAAQAISAGSR